jgi:hypothetical protein
VLCAQTPPLIEMMRSCKCSTHLIKMPTLTYNWVGSAAEA